VRQRENHQRNAAGVALHVAPPNAQNGVRAGTNFMSGFNVIWVVQMFRKKHFASAVAQIRFTTPAILSHQRGVGHRRKRGAGSGGREGCD
jgi:hypothetical protein